MSPAKIFKELHSNPEKPLILPNVWDAGGARIVESLGAKAVATTSAGVAWSKGYRDGNEMPVQWLAYLAREIVQAVKVPVTVDFEAGYSEAPAQVAANIQPLIDAGISGINIEDGTDEPEVLAKKIEAIKRLGIDLFINARTDVYFQDLVPDKEKVKETLKRAELYRSAGADGLFVPGLTDAPQINEITTGTALPINLMAMRGLPKANELAKLGVRRLSTGGALSKIANTQIARFAEAFLKEGDSEVLNTEAMTHSQLQQFFEKRG